MNAQMQHSSIDDFFKAAGTPAVFATFSPFIWPVSQDIISHMNDEMNSNANMSTAAGLGYDFGLSLGTLAAAAIILSSAYFAKEGIYLPLIIEGITNTGAGIAKYLMSR